MFKCNSLLFPAGALVALIQISDTVITDLFQGWDIDVRELFYINAGFADLKFAQAVQQWRAFFGGGINIK